MYGVYGRRQLLSPVSIMASLGHNGILDREYDLLCDFLEGIHGYRKVMGPYSVGV